MRCYLATNVKNTRKVLKEGLLDQSWLFFGISHPTKTIPIPAIKNPCDILKVKILKLRKIPNPGNYNPEIEKNPEIKKSRKNPECQKTVKRQNFTSKPDPDPPDFGILGKPTLLFDP